MRKQQLSMEADGRASVTAKMKTPVRNKTGGAQTSLQVLPNMQFLYELHLAMLELRALGLPAKLGEGLREFTIPGARPKQTAELLKRSAYIGAARAGEHSAQISDYAKLTQYNATRAFNQYITHWFYPYKGKYHPQMVRALANIIGLRAGQTLLDPFIGSGTTAVEGGLLGLNVIGFDVSPLCVLISEVKANALHELPENAAQEDAKLFESALQYESNAPRRMPKNMAEKFDLLADMIATSDSARRGRDYAMMRAKNRAKMLQSVKLMREACAAVKINPPPAAVKVGDARALPLADHSIDGVITSPPYSLALNYVENDAHSLAALGFDTQKIREEFIGVRGAGKTRMELYQQDMQKAYGEIARVLKPAGKAAIVLGDATLNGQKVPNEQRCIDTFADLGFRLVHHVDKLIYGIYNVMQREAILVFSREK